MTHRNTSARIIRVSILISLFAYLSIGPNACIKAPRFANLTLVHSLAGQAPVPNYTYTMIADASHCDAGNPVLNNKGEAAFVTFNCTGPNAGPFVHRGNGGPLTEIYTFKFGETPFSVPDTQISINDNGTVAFPAFTPFDSPIRWAILVGDGGPVSTIVDTGVHTQFKIVQMPSINNAAAVAFRSTAPAAGSDSIVVANGGSFVTIAGPDSTTPIGALVATYEPALNNNGLVSFFAQGTPGYGLLVGSGGPLTPISLNNNPSTWSQVNDLGRVAFVVNSTSVEWGDGLLVRTVASNPTYQSFSSSEVSINNASVVAFQAKTASSAFGIYIGPNPTTDAVIKAGDVIPGLGTVTAVSMSEEAINDAGQVAFAVLANKADGTVARAIVRADPIRIATMTTLGVSPNPGVFGQPVTLTASVAPTSGVATGQVEFFSGATLLGAASLVNGVALFQTSALALGSHRLLAMFGGSDGFLPSISPAVPVSIDPAPPLQAPIELRASSIVGNLVTLRWKTSSIGPTPTSYVIEGGITPGQVLASVPTNSASPIVTVAAPNGAFYVRMHAIAGAQRSAASNEIRIFVNGPTPPSPPLDLVALVNGSSLALTWRQTFLGGAATSHVLSVTGSMNTSLPLGARNSFSFNGVPGGTYTFTVSASNAGGTSAPSNAVTLTFPGPCSGAPLTPPNFLAYRVGNTVTVVWDPPASGAAPTSYVLNVSGTFAGSFSTTGLTFGGTVGPGSYGLSVVASNACGSSPSTSVQTITVP